MRIVMLIGAALIVYACAPNEVRYGRCDKGSVQLLTDFEGARAGSCNKTGYADFKITIEPEATPINPSPWYAFDIVAEEKTEARIRLKYKSAWHRYRPKIRVMSEQWRAIPEEWLNISKNKERVSIEIPLSPGRTRISAQETFATRDHNALEMRLAENADARRVVIGNSHDGRELTMVKSGPSDPGTPLVILIGRQHPPEVPGAFALAAFTERIFEDDDLAGEFRAMHALRIISLLNPDGVVRGYWRFNANLVDLNRDWGPFTQPETAAVKSQIEQAADSGLDPVLLLDFHATRRDVFYTQPDNAGLHPENFAANWMARLAGSICGEIPERNSAWNVDLPTAKSWFPNTYLAPAITVELGDESDRAHIRHIARVAAAAMMRELLGIESRDRSTDMECANEP